MVVPVADLVLLNTTVLGPTRKGTEKGVRRNFMDENSADSVYSSSYVVEMLVCFYKKSMKPFLLTDSI